MRLVMILFLVTLVGMIGCESREQARRKQVANNLKQLGLALHAYHASNLEPANNNEPAPSEEDSLTVAPKVEGKIEVEQPPPSLPE